jgi:transcriptional regulator with XRE-family HTH domain
VQGFSRHRMSEILAAIGDESKEGVVTTAIMKSLGELLREARSGRFTIEELAKLSNVSAGRISQIERGIANPSFETLWRLCTALGVSIGSLFPAGAHEPQQVVRRDERRKLATHDGLVYEMLTPNGQGSLEILLLEIPVGYDGGVRPPLTHRGEKFIHVQGGRMLVSVGGRDWTLEVGDSITFDATVPHFVANAGEDTAHIQLVITPPSF